MKKRLIVSFLLLVATFLLGASKVDAQYGCGQYSSCPPNQTITIEKLVAMPGSSTNFVNNLTPSDPRYHAGDAIYFRIKVKNTSNQPLQHVTVVDTFPDYIVLNNQYYNPTTHEMTLDAGDFAPGEEKIFDIQANIVGANALPWDQGLICKVNNVRVTMNGIEYDHAASQFCIEKQVVGVSQVPSTGPEFGLLLVSGELLTLGAGMFLKRKVK